MSKTTTDRTIPETPDARKASLDDLRARDAELFPWGPPGAVPIVTGDFWVWIPRENRVRGAYAVRTTNGDLSWYWLEAAMSWSHVGLVAHALANGWRFRARWTPAAPQDAAA